METIAIIAGLILLTFMTKQSYTSHQIIEVNHIRFKLEITGYRLWFVYHKVINVKVISSDVTLDIKL